MKLIKRLGAIATAIAVMLTVGSVSAFADTPPTTPTGSLTIQGLDGNTKTTSTFVAYQLITFNASVANSKTYFTDLKLNSSNTDIYKNAIISAISGLSSTSTPNDIFSAIQGLNAAQSEKFAAALKTSLTGTAVTPIQNTSGGIFSSLPYGYYLVVETSHDASDGSLISDPFLVCIPENGASTIVKDRTVKVKTSTANVVKKIVVNPGTSNEILVDSSTAAIGDTVEYQAISSIPTYSDSDTNITYSLTDTLSKGLDFNSIEKVSIIGGPSEIQLDSNDYTLTPNQPTKDSNSGETIFNVNLTNSGHIRQWGNAGYRLKIRYSAKLNDSAQYGETGNPNSIHLTYSIRDGSTKTTDDDTVITYTYRLVVTKTDNSSAQNKLAGATFELQKQDSDGTWKPVDSHTTSSVTGTTAFTHLQQGNYQLVETKAPDGYNLCDPIQFTVTATNTIVGKSYSIPDPTFLITEIGNTNVAKDVIATWDMPKSSGNFTFNITKDELDVTITDTPGFILPGTGGIGTTIFTVSGIGILLIGGCLALLYFRKKRRSER